MPNVYQPKLIQVKAQYDPAPDTGEHPVNVMWLQAFAAGPYTVAQLTAIAALVDTNWSAVWTKVGSPSYHYIGSTITDWTANTGLQYSSVGVLTPIAGGTSGSTLNPLQVAVLVSWKQSIRYKGGHGRSYLPYTNNAIVLTTDPRTIGAVVVGQVNTALAAYFTAMAAAASPGPFTPCTYRFRNNALKANVSDFLSATCSNVVATQRRRLRKTAHH